MENNLYIIKLFDKKDNLVGTLGSFTLLNATRISDHLDSKEYTRIEITRERKNVV